MTFPYKNDEKSAATSPTLERMIGSKPKAFYAIPPAGSVEQKRFSVASQALREIESLGGDLEKYLKTRAYEILPKKENPITFFE